MRRFISCICILLFVSILCCCGTKKQAPESYFNFQHRQVVCTMGEELYWFIGDGIYKTALNQERLSLEKVCEVRSATTLYSKEKDLQLLSRPDNDGIYVHTITMDKDLQVIYNWNEEKYYNPESPMILDGNVCYYVGYIPEDGGEGAVLKKVNLKSGEVSVVYSWEDRFRGYSNPCIGCMKIYDNYLVFDYETSADEYNGIWVYDIKKEQMILEAQEDMIGLSYYDGKLYYIDEENAKICIWDLKKGKEAEGTFNLEYCVLGMSLMCDEQYIYVNPSKETIDDSEVSYQIWVYDYNGNLVDQFDLSENEDAFEKEHYKMETYNNVKCSTEKYLFVGDRMINPSCIYYVEKDKIGTDELIVHTLYIR